MTKAKAKIAAAEKPLAAGETATSCGNPPCKGANADAFLAAVRKRGAAKARQGVKGCVAAKVRRGEKQPSAQAACDAEADADAAKAFGAKRKDRRGDRDLEAEEGAGAIMMACTIHFMTYRGNISRQRQ